MGIDFQKVDNTISQVEKSDSLIGGWSQPGKPREERKNHTHTHRHMEFAMAGANTGKGHKRSWTGEQPTGRSSP